MSVLRKACLALYLAAICSGLSVGAAQHLPLPPRPAEALSGSQFAAQIAELPFEEREERIVQEVLSGNVPDFLREFVELPIELGRGTNAVSARLYVAPDYLAIGSDSDYLLMPMSPMAAQRVADALGCCLPTRKLVDIIHCAAPVKLTPSPIAPGPGMTTVAWFSNHNATVLKQRKKDSHSLGALVAGHKKDVVVSLRLAAADGKVAIYGWHPPDGTPIQPLYLGHTARWVDYSHGIRLVRRAMTINGKETTVAECLARLPEADLLSDEGPVELARYPTNFQKTVAAPPVAPRPGPPFLSRLEFPFRDGPAGEKVAELFVEPETRIYVNLPFGLTETNNITILFYALPNGNTIEQTLGKTLAPGDDWHFDIQHVLAQTRFLRTVLTNRMLVLVLLQSEKLSWPAWRKKHGDSGIPPLLNAIVKSLPGRHRELVLNGHSGGGSLIFGYINSVSNIPPAVVRIAFLDSNYAYDREAGHCEKLVRWLQDGSDHYLCVLAYNDAVALLNGKTFVSAEGGTWGRSHAMQRDLAETFEFTSTGNDDLRVLKALDGRVQFLLKENPEKKILHTVQVELNGLIHSMLTGSTNENRNYEYFGPRAYSEHIP